MPRLLPVNNVLRASMEEAGKATPPIAVLDGKNEDGVASDPELEELLDVSLNEFGKHVPKDPKFLNSSSSTAAPNAPKSSDNSAEAVPSSGEGEMEDMFGSEFLAEMETQLGEAMKVMSDENPELLQQLDSFTKSLGLEDLGAGATPPTSGTTTKGESSVDSCSGSVGGARKEAEKGDGEGQGKSDPLEHMLEETMRKLQQNTAKTPEGGPGPGGLGGLGDMMGQLDLGSEESEDQFMKMMQGMMSTLLSKDVLYPSLVELRKQYPDWLEKNCNSVSEADLKRYKKQLQIMTTICDEFEKPGREGGEGQGQSVSERILQLMQELQRYGQPPADLATEAQPGMQGMPPGMGNVDPQNCSIM